MPRAATGSEVLDINNLLSAVSNYKEFAPGEGFLSIDIYDAKEEVFQFAKSKFLERILNAADNLTDATQAAVDATGGGSPKAIPDDMNAVKIELGKDRKTITKMLPSKSGSHNDTLDWLSGRAERSRPDTHYRQPIIKKP